MSNMNFFRELSDDMNIDADITRLGKKSKKSITLKKSKESHHINMMHFLSHLPINSQVDNVKIMFVLSVFYFFLLI